MSDTPSTPPDVPLIDYPSLVRNALLTVPREVIRLASEHGLPGEHHLFLTFRTDHPEAEVPPRLRQQYPEQMTIVLQHQFWDLAVEEHRFIVTLRFGGAPQRLVVPFDALTAFVDPSVPFGLRLTPDALEAAQGEAPKKSGEERSPEAAPATVVDLASFRRERGEGDE